MVTNPTAIPRGGGHGAGEMGELALDLGGLSV
jgi:hypothetical protein